MSVKIGSLNVRGMQNKIKRRKIFNMVRNQKYDIFFQETHSGRVQKINGATSGASNQSSQNSQLRLQESESYSRKIAILWKSQNKR